MLFKFVIGGYHENNKKYSYCFECFSHFGFPMKPKHKKSHFFATKGLFTNLRNFSDLENKVSNLPETERGDAFEVFAEAYFSTQVLYQVEEVWPEKVMPQGLRDKLGIRSDAGVDGVFKTNSGSYHSYQVKFRANRSALTWDHDKLANFFGQSDHVDGRVLFTNSNDVSQVAKDRRDFYSVKGNDLDALEQPDFQAIEDWLKSGIVVREKKSPRPHQKEAMHDILEELKINDRTTTIMACGTGKTLVALWVAEKTEAQAILVLLPSLALVRQTLHDWARQNSWDTFNYLCVCSDDTVIKADDETILQHYDLDFPVTTQKEVIEQFLQNQSLSGKIIFSTYQSSQIVAEAKPNDFSFDFGIFDEAHKTASRQGANYSFALQDKNVAIKKRLFLTATPRHYNVAKKDKEGDQQLVFSMDDQKVYGRVAHQLSFRKAVEKDLICDYKVLISIVTSDMLTRELLKQGDVVVGGDIVKAQRVAHILAMQSAVNAYGIKRIFSFHNSVNSAKSFTADTNEGVGAYLQNFTTLHVNGEMPTSKREKLLREFEESDKAIISNARCLTEGVNVPVVDMVAFVSPKKSRVDIVQAAGRAMRKSEGKKFGYILIPLFLELAEDETVEQACEKTKFDTVWNVLQAMQEQDESLVEIIAKMREEKGRALGGGDNRLREKVEILGPELYINELRKAITTRISDNLGVIWDERFGELIEYKELHGDCNVPEGYSKNQSLANWVSAQRCCRRKNNLTQNRIDKLDGIGFVWNLKDDPIPWQQSFDELVLYKKEHGNCNVPRDYSKNKKFGQWVVTQRTRYKKGRMPICQIEQLNSIEFSWEQLKDDFKVQYDYLLKFRELYPYRWPKQDEKFPEGNRLGSWCSNKRSNKKNLERWKIDLLDKIGFAWNKHDHYFELRYSYLVAFRTKYPNRWPEDKEQFPEGINLGRWCDSLRQRYKNKEMREWQIKKLETINFPWNLEEFYWTQQYEYLVEFRKNYSNRWPKKGELFPNENKLEVWCSTQKSRLKRGTLLDWQIEKLKVIGFSLKTNLKEKHIANWLKQYGYLLDFRKIYPDQWPTNNQIFPGENKLGYWNKNQKRRRNRLAAWQVKKLDEIHFPWIVDVELNNQKNWLKKYSYLVEFRKLFPNLWPLRNEEFPNGNNLGSWCYDQEYRKDQLSEFRIKKLNEIGFYWDRLKRMN